MGGNPAAAAPGGGVGKFGGNPPGGGGKPWAPGGMLGRGGRPAGGAAPAGPGKGGGKGRPLAPGAVFMKVRYSWCWFALWGIGATYEACPVRRVRPEEAFQREVEGVDLVGLNVSS